MSSKAVEPTGEVHPVADLFPMMTDDELDDLAADIKANGLLHPIVLDENGMLIDGRNRLAGCLRAGVEPLFSSLNGHDPVAFILASNVSRRHLSKGQQAMAVAGAWKLSKNDRSASGSARLAGIKQSYVAMAVTVLEYASDLADAVFCGVMSLNEAYEEARNRKRVVDGLEAQKDRLRSEAPDLAGLVHEERLTLAEALAALEKRRRDEQSELVAVSKNLDRLLTLGDPLGLDPMSLAEKWTRAIPALAGEQADFSAARARRTAEVLVLYADMMEANGNGE